MTEEAKVATQQGATEGEPGTHNGEPAREDRQSYVEQLAARRAEQVRADSATPEPEMAPEPERAATDTAAQLDKQLDAGQVVLDNDVLSRALVRTVVDGKEELVPAAKVLAQFQKAAAADVRLAEATRMTREAQELLDKAKADSAQRADQVAKQTKETVTAEAQERIAQLTKEHSLALYAGDEEKAAKLLGDIVSERVAIEVGGRTQQSVTLPTPEQLAEQALPALKQKLSVDSALETLRSNYPEIWNDADYALLADKHRERLEAEGYSRPDAIALAGDAIGEKFGLGKFKTKDVAAAVPTTREQKLAAKQGLDEPTSANARAQTPAVVPMTASQVIAEMAAQRSHVSR